MSECFEIVMVLCFGASWPFNIARSLRARTARGKSPFFLVCILVGYIAGIIAKLTDTAYLAAFDRKWYVLIFYCINLVMVGIDLLLYFRNRTLDRRADAAAAKEARA